MKAWRDGWKFNFEVKVPAWVCRLLRLNLDPRTIVHGQSSRNWRDRHGIVDVTVTETTETKGH